MLVNIAVIQPFVIPMNRLKKFSTLLETDSISFFSVNFHRLKYMKKLFYNEFDSELNYVKLIQERGIKFNIPFEAKHKIVKNFALSLRKTGICSFNYSENVSDVESAQNLRRKISVVENKLSLVKKGPVFRNLYRCLEDYHEPVQGISMGKKICVISVFISGDRLEDCKKNIEKIVKSKGGKSTNWYKKGETYRLSSKSVHALIVTETHKKKGRKKLLRKVFHGIELGYGLSLHINALNTILNSKFVALFDEWLTYLHFLNPYVLVSDSSPLNGIVKGYIFSIIELKDTFSMYKQILKIAINYKDLVLTELVKLLNALKTLKIPVTPKNSFMLKIPETSITNFEVHIITILKNATDNATKIVLPFTDKEMREKNKAGALSVTKIGELLGFDNKGKRNPYIKAKLRRLVDLNFIEEMPLKGSGSGNGRMQYCISKDLVDIKKNLDRLLDETLS